MSSESTWRVGIIEVGIIPRLPAALYDPAAPPDAFLDVPCFVYALRSDDGAVLVDTGPDAVAAATSGYDIVGDTRSALLGGLAALGIQPGDVGHVVHTHLHYDHAQNDGLFPLAEVVVQAAELDWALQAGAAFYVDGDRWRRGVADRLRVVSGSSTLVPGVDLMQNGGHTPGHQSVLVATESGRVCVCGDIVSMAVNADIVGSVCPDVEATRTFLVKAREAGWTLLPSHEPALRRHPWYINQ
jgi:N-acyl homoserine lactone hydrolase